jgi:hypothetical protein
MRFSANALCELEDAIGMGVNAVATQMSDPSTMRLTMVRTVFWAGLRDHHPDITLHQAGEIITDLSLTKAMELVSKAFELAFQDNSKAHPQKPGQKSPAISAAAGTGLPS